MGVLNGEYIRKCYKNEMLSKMTAINKNVKDYRQGHPCEIYASRADI
jgi:hypothetical protein